MDREVKVTSFVPGRVRLKVSGLESSPGFVESVEADLCAVPGVKEVCTNEKTGSVLIRYDRKTVSSPESLDALTAVIETHFPALDIPTIRKYLGKKR